MTKSRTAVFSYAVAIMFILSSCGDAAFTNNILEKQKVVEIPKESLPINPKVDLPADGPSFKLSLAYSSSSDDISHYAFVEFAKKLETQSGGKIKLILFPNGQLGGDREIMEGVRMGNISMAITATSAQLEFIPDVAVFDIPGIFDSLEQSPKVFNGSFKQAINPSYNKAGLELICLNSGGFRIMSSNVPVQTFEDFKKITIRTTDNKYHMAFWRNLGTYSLTLPFSELYVALQQDIVKAQENPLNAVYASRFYEVQKYIINMKYIMMVRALVMNKNVYDSMPADYQKLVAKLAEERKKFLEDDYLARQAELEKNLTDNGMRFIELSDEVKSQIFKACLPVIASIRKDVGNKLADALLAEIEAARK